MALMDRIRACNRHDPDRFRPFTVAGARVGRVPGDYLETLTAWPDVLTVTDDGVTLNPALETPHARTAALHTVVQGLAERGIIRVRDEPYRVARAFHESPFLEVDRGAVVFFGLHSYGVHVNGHVYRDGRPHLWIGRRAADKAVAPDQLDNMVAGGQPARLGLMENIVKEAHEEARVPADLARRARPASTVTYCLETARGLKVDTLFCYDLEVPADFVPHNDDGEMVDFRLMPADEAVERVARTTDFKFNVNLVITDFALRHGLIDPDTTPDYEALVAGLRAPLP